MRKSPAKAKAGKSMWGFYEWAKSFVIVSMQKPERTDFGV